MYNKYGTCLYLTLLLLLYNLSAQAHAYYIKATGSDSNTGTSIAKAWKTTNPLYKITLVAGDSILFQGGDTIKTHFYISPSDSGTIAKPIVFTSYGKGRAIIYADTFWAFFAYNTGGLDFENLEFMGSGVSTNTQSGFFYYTDALATHTYNQLKLSNLYIHGFGASGIELGCDDSLYRGLRYILISHTEASDNGKSGISTYDRAGKHDRLYGFKKLQISYCNVFRNGANGIVTGGVDSAIIDHCCAAYTGLRTNRGTAGIWAWSCRNLLIQHCISHHIKTVTGDGEGFDLDGGTYHCIVQYCYAYNNDGLGFMHCDYPASRPTHQNVIRYCLSQNDGRKHLMGGCGFLFNSWGTGLDSCLMHNNDVYISDNDSSIVAGFAAYIEQGYDTATHIRHCAARNNIIYVAGKNKNRLVDLNGGSQPIQDTNLIFQGNCYYSAKSSSHTWHNEFRAFTRMSDWQDSLHQELFSGYKQGDTLHPLWQNAGKAPTMYNTDSLVYIDAYKLQSTSPMIDAGLNLDSLFGTNIGPYDFYRNNPKQGSRQDIGLYEAPHSTANVFIEQNSNYITIYPQPAHGTLLVHLKPTLFTTHYILYDLSSRRVSEYYKSAATLHTLDISMLAPGTYILSIRTGTTVSNCKVLID